MKHVLGILLLASTVLSIPALAQSSPATVGGHPLKTTYVRLASDANAILVEPVTPDPAKGRIAVLVTHPGHLNNFEYFIGREGIHVPTLVLSGTCAQHLVFLEIAYDRSVAKDKELVGVEGADHWFVPCKPEYGPRLGIRLDRGREVPRPNGGPYERMARRREALRYDLETGDMLRA
jgi:hypothetical protein